MDLQKRIADKIDTIMLDMSTQRIPKMKTGDFRVSSLPMCPLRELIFNEGGDSFSMSFYTSIGTAVHENIQKWLTLGNFKDDIFACWKVKETGEVLGPCYRNEIPSKYDNYTIEYEEITIKYKGLSGHVDLVMELFDNQCVVVDFKTSDLQSNKRRFPTWQNKYPASRSSIIQISTYATLIRELFGLNIVAWCLIYIDRGKVIRTKHDYHQVLRPWNKKKHDAMLERIDESCENDARFRKLLKQMNESSGYNPEAVKTLKELVVHRPCYDEESYNEWMDYKFFKRVGKGEPGEFDGKCVLKKHCMAGNKACYKAVQDKLK